MPRPHPSSPSTSPCLSPISDKPHRNSSFFTRLKTYRPKNRTHTILLIALFTILISLTLAVIFHVPISKTFSALLPQACPSRTPTVFVEHGEYQTFSPSADKLWEDLVTPNGGLIVDSKVNNGEPYGLAMFHQLHCITMVRKSFQELYARIDGKSDGKNNVLFEIDEGHLLHCLDYMRQTALCYADGAVEAGHPMKNPEVPYYCSDSDVWYERSKKLGIVDIN